MLWSSFRRNLLLAQCKLGDNSANSHWLGSLLTHMAACFCPEGQGGAEGGNGLADSPANVLRDHCQHVLLWWWVLRAQTAVLTPGIFHQHYVLWHSHPVLVWIWKNTFMTKTCMKPLLFQFLDVWRYPWLCPWSIVFVCLFRPFWWRVGGGVQQRWEWYGSWWALWRSVKSDVSAVFVSGGSHSINEPQHPWKGKYLFVSSTAPANICSY